MAQRQARYLRVAEDLRSQVRQMPPNSALPTEHQLARRFSVSRATVRFALDLLEQSGLVSRRRGRGTLVSPPKIARRLSPLWVFEEDLWEQEIKFETRVLAHESHVAPPDFVRTLLKVNSDAQVGRLSLVRVVDDQVVSHDQRYFPSAMAERFDPLLLEARPIYSVLEELAGETITTVNTESEIVPCPPDVANVLGLTPGTLIVANTFVYYLASGNPVEVGVMFYRIDRFKFKFSEGSRQFARSWGSRVASGEARNEVARE